MALGDDLKMVCHTITAPYRFMLWLHGRFVWFITRPSMIKQHKAEKHLRRHINVTCIFKGHTFFVDFNEKTQRCTRCGKLERLDDE